MSRAGTKASWVSFDDSANAMLPYGGSSNTKSFDLIVLPDDSVNSGSSNKITIQAKSGSTLKCSSDISIILGQSFGAEISLVTSSLGPIEPGETNHQRSLLPTLVME